MTIQNRETGAFSAVELRGVGDVRIEMGDTPSLRIEAADDALAEIITEVVGDKLLLRLDPWKALKMWGTSQRADFYITAPSLRSVTVSGAGAVQIDGLRADNLDLTITGAGTVRAGISVRELHATISGSGEFVLAGTAVRQEIRITGAGAYDASQVDSTDAIVFVGGAGKANIKVSGTLDVQIAGAGAVRYQGSPQVTQRIGGFGSVERIGD